MKKLLLSIVALVAAVTIWAVPAYRGWQTKTQPDGSTIEVRQVGDEFYHYWESMDGQLVLEQEDGTFVVSNEPKPTSAQIKAKRNASSLKSSKPRKAIGKLNKAPRGLLILVQFSNVSFNSGNDNTAFTDMLNKTGYDYNGATGSAVDYFKAQSNNDYKPVFDVVGPVTLSNTRKYYGEQGKINGYQENDMYIADFVIDAVTAAEAAGCDFSQYDADKDGYVDIVYFIYAGKGQAGGGTTETIWPHNWELISALYYGQTHGTSGYYVNADSQGNITSMNIPRFDGKYINNYACSAELRTDGNRSGIGTFCHEFGHVLGLPDYYVTDESASNEDKGYTPGAWSIMDYGSYNNNEMTPPNYSAYDKLFMGWDTPELLSKNAQQNVTLTTDYSSSYQITGTTSAATATTQQRVWYLENRQKTGWDTYLPGHGLLVWEVTYNSDDWTNNEPNNENIGYTIVTANSLSRPYTPCVYNTTATSTSGTTFPGTSNVTSFTPATGCAITNIAENDGVITFKYNGGELNYWTYGFEGTNCTITGEASGQVDKGAALNLTITPNAGYTLSDADCWAVEMGSVLLEYGTGFAFNEGTGAFSIASVTGNVYIIATAQEVPATITWMDKGETFTTTQTSAGKLVLPENEPEACERKVFYGWTATANYSSEDTAPTIVKAGDDATQTTYYAVFATEGEGAVAKHIYLDADSVSSSYGTNTEVTRCGVTCYYTNVMKSSGSQIQMKKNGSYIANKTELAKIDSIIIDGTTSLTVYAGTSAKPSSTSITRNGKKYDLSGGEYSYFKIINNSNNAVYADEISIYYSAGGTAYSDYTTTCVPPTKYAITVKEAENGSLETNPADEAAAGKKVTITATPDTHYHLATLSVKDAEDGDVEVSGEGNERTFIMPEKAVTISATFAADDQYTVRFFNNGIELSSKQYYAGETAEKPADPEKPCEAYEFVGWWTAELAADNTSAKTWITNFTVSAAQDYYAIYADTVVDGGASIVSIEASDFSSVGSGSEIGTKTVNGITFKGAQGSHQSNAPAYYSGNPNTLRCYVGNKLTISADNAISQIDFNYDGSYSGGTIARSTGSWASTPTEGWLQTWTGEATSIQFTINGSGQWRITELQVSIGGGSTTYYTSTVSCGTTGVEETNANAKAVKVLRNGQIFILREGRTYTLTGNLVK